MTVTAIIETYAPREIRQNNNPKSRRSLRCPLCFEYVPEESNSFTVAEDNNLWRCFACGQKGNALQLLQLLGPAPDPTPKWVRDQARGKFKSVHLSTRNHEGETGTQVNILKEDRRLFLPPKQIAEWGRLFGLGDGLIERLLTCGQDPPSNYRLW